MVEITFKRIPWTEDEVILALDLYLQHGALDDTDQRVLELSELLRSLPLHPQTCRSSPKLTSTMQPTNSTDDLDKPSAG